MERYRFRAFSVIEKREMFRMLTILPGLDSDDVCCVQSIEPVSGASEYEALSYCYGTFPVSHKIFVSDAESVNQFRFINVRSNLFGALKRLRLTDKPRRVWIDCLCINQEDKFEKALQIQLMRTIYERAKAVLIWLGEHAHNSEAALDLVPRVVPQMVEDFVTGYNRDMFQPESRPDDWPEVTDPVWRDLYKILERPWFGRAWIVQELAVAPDAIVICGCTELPWESLMIVIFGLSQIGMSGMLGAARVSYHVWNLHYHRKNFGTKQLMSSLQLLLRYRRQAATDPRDAVFAFHGLFDIGSPGHHMTRPDYNIDCRDVFINVASSILQETRSLDLLTVARSQEQSSVELLPSWVPDWSMSDDCLSLLRQDPDLGSKQGLPLDQRPQYSASGISTYTLLLSDNNSKLHLEGFMIAQIQNVSLPGLPESGGGFDLEVIASNCRMFDTIEEIAFSDVPGIDWWCYPYTKESLQEAYWRTLIAGKLQYPEDETIGMFFTFYESLMFSRRLTAAMKSAGEDRERIGMEMLAHETRRVHLSQQLGLTNDSMFTKLNRADIFKEMMAPVRNRRMTKTADGLIGLVPMLAQVDDFIVLVEGGKTPYVLRQRFNAKISGEISLEYEFIGEAYIHGIMDGAAWNERKIRHEQMQKFVLV